MTLQELQTQFETAKHGCSQLHQKLSAAAEAQGRALSATEKASIEESLREAKALKARLDGMQTDANMLGAIAQLTGDMMRPSPRRAGSLGAQFVNSDAMRWWQENRHKLPQAWQSPSVELYATTLDESSASGGDLVLPDTQPGIVTLPTRPLTVADLIAPGTTTSEPGDVHEGNDLHKRRGPGPRGGDETGIDARLRCRQLSGEKDRALDSRYGGNSLGRRADAQLCRHQDATRRRPRGRRSAAEWQRRRREPHRLSGPRRSRRPPAARRRLQRRRGSETDLGDFRGESDSTRRRDSSPDELAHDPVVESGGGEYLSGAGPFATPQRPVLWGLPVAVSPVIAVGTALVGCYRTASQLFRNGGIRVDVSNSHSDFFVKNLVAIRAERREALAVYRAACFGTVTGLN